MKADMNLSGYKTSTNVLLKMIKDEIKSSDILKFGYQEIDSGEEVFFAISTQMIKNFDFEKELQSQDSRTTGKGSNLTTKFILNRANRKLDFNSGYDKLGGRKGGPMPNSELFTNAPYHPYGVFDIVVWMILRVSINPI
jgi:hypothetical protein